MKWLMFSLLLLICFILSFRFRTSEADGDIKSDLEETLEANGTSTNDSITNAKEDSSMNKTNFIKPLCTEDGCNPRLNCSNLTSISLINETYMNIFTQPRVVNVSAHQLQYILEDSLFTNSCVLVLFYAAWCPYSIDFTPTYNALAKYFPQLTVLAMDFGNENQERFLLAYIPRILLYYSGRAVYNVDTSLSNETLVKIITNITGYMPLNLTVEELARVSDDSPLPIAWSFDSTMYICSIIAISIIAIVHLLKMGGYGGWMVSWRDFVRRQMDKLKVD